MVYSFLSESVTSTATRVRGSVLFGTYEHFSPLFLFYFFHLTYSRWTSSLPSCLSSLRIFPSLPDYLSRYKFNNLTTRQPMVEFYLLAFPRFPLLQKKEHASYCVKNRTHNFRTSRCADYLLDYSGDERWGYKFRFVFDKTY